MLPVIRPDKTLATLQELGLEKIPDDLARRVGEAAREVSWPAGTTLFAPGDRCPGWLVVKSGSVKVAFTSDTGREIVLYHVERGETCVLTTACLLGEEPYSASGVTEVPTTALLIPVPVVLDLIERSSEFRATIFRGFGRRLTSILMTMEEALFHPLEPRLANLLLRQRNADDCVPLTQAEIASELGSAREVVARHLARLEAQGVVLRQRGQVQVTDVGRLTRIVLSA